MGYFGEIDTVHLKQPIALFLAIVREFAGDIEQEDLYPPVALLDQHTGHCQSVAAVVAGAGDYDDALAGQESRHNLAAHHRCGTLHQVD